MSIESYTANNEFTNTEHVPGPYSAAPTPFGVTGEFYLDPSSPVKKLSGTVVTEDELGRLTTHPAQTPEQPETLADPGYHYHIRCSDLPTFTPVPSPPPTTPTPTPTGPTATPTVYISATPTRTPTPYPTPTGTTLPMGYTDDFEGGSGHWTTSGLWHIPSAGSPMANACSGEFSFRYGRENLPDYNTGTANSGELVLDPVFVEGSHTALTFNSWEKTEGVSTGVDTRTIWASEDNGATWMRIYQSTDNSGQWRSVCIPLSFSDQYIIFKFRFDTVDEHNNDFRGWYIDDVYVGAGPLPSLSVAGILLLLAAVTLLVMRLPKKRREPQR